MPCQKDWPASIVEPGALAPGAHYPSDYHCQGIPSTSPSGARDNPPLLRGGRFCVATVLHRRRSLGGGVLVVGARRRRDKPRAAARGARGSFGIGPFYPAWGYGCGVSGCRLAIAARRIRYGRVQVDIL